MISLISFLPIIAITGLNLFVKLFLIIGNSWVYSPSDSMYHLSIAREIRKQRKIPKLFERFYLFENYSYPPLLHVILSKFPVSKEHLAQSIGTFFDSATTAIIGVFSLIFFDQYVSIGCMLLYVCSSYALQSHLGASAESLATTFVTAFAFATFLAVQPQFFYVFVLIASISAAIVIMSHRLSTQSLIVIAISESFWSKGAIPVVELIIGFALTFIILRKRYYESMIDHLRFIKNRGKWHLSQYRVLLSHHKIAQFFNLLWWPRTVAINFPLLALLPIAIYYEIWTPVNTFLLYWVIGLLLLFLFWIPGRGFRHLSSMTPALVIIVAETMEREPFVIPLAILLISASLFLKYRYVIRGGNFRVSSNYIRACAFINMNTGPDDLVLSIPLSDSYNLLFFTNCKVLEGSGGNPNGREFNQRMAEAVASNPDLSGFLAQYKPKYVLASNSELSKVKGEIKYQNNEYTVVKV